MAAALFILRNSSSKLQAFTNISHNIFYPSVSVLNNTNFSRKFTQLTNSNKANNLVAKSPLSLNQRCMSADHSKLWPIEKILSASLIAIVPGTFLLPNPIFDNLFAVAVVIHMHWGLEACVEDYVRPIILGPVIPKLTMGLLYLVSIGTLGSLLYYNYKDIGIGKTVRQFWAIKE